nr:RecName: Full=U10-ctenitoxin-Pr1a; Short=U10-CNTX-Pr1a; AltName: Full=Non-toxic venom protein PRTx22C5 [Phoneutria reidyi]
SCADAYKSCDSLKCCNNRTCMCSMIGTNCTCRKK